MKAGDVIIMGGRKYILHHIDASGFPHLMDWVTGYVGAYLGELTDEAITESCPKNVEWLSIRKHNRQVKRSA